MIQPASQALGAYPGPSKSGFSQPTALHGGQARSNASGRHSSDGLFPRQRNGALSGSRSSASSDESQEPGSPGFRSAGSCSSSTLRPKGSSGAYARSGNDTQATIRLLPLNHAGRKTGVQPEIRRPSHPADSFARLREARNGSCQTQRQLDRPDWQATRTFAGLLGRNVV